MTTRKAKAVLISDVHFNLKTLKTASKALEAAVAKANELDCRLIIAGDLHDTKANVRGECMWAIRSILKRLRYRSLILIGNHDMINEKGSTSDHSLSFLEDIADIVDRSDLPFFTAELALIPYQHDKQDFIEMVEILPKNTPVICHQGLIGSVESDHFQEPNAIQQEAVAGLYIISGHYHYRQEMALPDGGKWTYLGNPYTLGFGEAEHPPKGIHVLWDDLELEFIELPLPRHRVFHIQFIEDDAILNATDYIDFKPQDEVLIKARGTAKQLAQVTKEWVREEYGIESNLRLDLIRTEEEIRQEKTFYSSQSELLDSIIDRLENKSSKDREHLKKLWRMFSEAK